MKKRFAYLSIFLLFTVFSCQSTKVFKLQHQGKIVTKQFLEEIPFKYHKKLILVEVMIRKRPYTFIYDTGASISLVDSILLEEMPMEKVAQKNISDSYSNKKSLPFYVLPDFKIGTVDFENFVATAVDLTDIKNYGGCEIQIAGILGNNIFRKAVWKIDYQKETMSFANNLESLPPAKNSQVLQFPKQKIGNAYVSAKLNNETQKFTIDTGFAGILTSNQSLFDKLKSQNSTLNFTEEKGITSISLHGLNYGIVSHVLLDSFTLGAIKLEEIVVKLKDNKNSSSLIGNEFWKNFILTFDWKNGNLFLEKNGTFIVENLEKFEYSIRPDYKNFNFKLSNQWLSHPTTFEVSPNNVIQSINGVDLTELNEAAFCDFKDNQLQKFKKKQEMTVVFKDEEEIKTVTLQKYQVLKK